MRDLPSGTVTLLFADIEGSTQLLHALGDRYPAALAEQRRLFRAAVAAHGGFEVDSQGDAFLCAFASARDAAAAAAEAQRAFSSHPWPDGHDLRVRMGIHTGEPTLTDEGYVGIDLHQGARVMAAGHGGQVLVSEATARLVDGIELRDLGPHRLKDLSDPQRLFQLGEGDFPPLKTLHATNLPIQPTPLVGRERELAELAALLAEHRLVTLTGPGGSGKTRLAVQAAAEAVDEFRDGVWWVSLQALRDPALVLPTIAQTLGARDELEEHIGARRMLIVIDNLEQVIDAAEDIAGLAAAAPNLKLLATSREPLQIAGEAEYELEPLPESDAVELFLARAQEREPLEAVREICRRLDGLPLAIELAAARTKLLPPAQLLARLEQRLPLLTRGRRDAPERQRTLRATIEWSYDLLAAGEKELFARLAVFAGSFDVEAADAVCEADFDALQSLVDKSLLRRWGSGRLGVLETIGEYARERLEESGAGEAMRRRLADYFLQLTRFGLQGGSDREMRELFDRLEQDDANQRFAVTWLVETAPVDALRLGLQLENYWKRRDRSAALVQRSVDELLRAVERAGDAEPELRSGALRLAGDGLKSLGEADLARELFARSLAIADAAGADAERAESLLRLDRGDEALAFFRRIGDTDGAAMALCSLASQAQEQGDAAGGRRLLEEAVTELRSRGRVWMLGHLFALLGLWALRAGDVDAAAQIYDEALTESIKLGDERAGVYALAGLAAVAATRRDTELAARLWGAVRTIEDEASWPIEEPERSEYEALLLPFARGAAFEEGRRTGREAFDIAREGVREPVGRMGRG